MCYILNKLLQKKGNRLATLLNKTIKTKITGKSLVLLGNHQSYPASLDY